MHLQTGPAAAAVRLRSPGSPAHRTTASIPHRRTDAHIHIHGSGIILGEAKRISANLGESRRTSAGLDGSRRISTDLDASRRISATLGLCPRGVRQRHVAREAPAGPQACRRRFREGSEKVPRRFPEEAPAGPQALQRRAVVWAAPHAAEGCQPTLRYVLSTPT